MDVACKERLDLVQRLGDIEASEQTTYLQRTQVYHEQIRRLDDQIVVLARRYMTGQGIEMP